MLVTSAEAAKMLRKLEEDKIALQEKEIKIRQYNAAVSENAEELKPDYSFVEYQNAINEVDRRMLKIKHAINVFNTTTVVYNDLTIDQVLVRLPQLTELKRKYYGMMAVPAKKRCNIVGSVIDYTYTSYDPAKASEYYEDVVKEINEIQTALDTVNNSLKFEVTW